MTNRQGMLDARFWRRMYKDTEQQLDNITRNRDQWKTAAAHLYANQGRCTNNDCMWCELGEMALHDRPEHGEK